MSDGTVRTVAVVGGTTGLYTTGGPVVVAGTISLNGILRVSNGGTGQTTAIGSLNALLPIQLGNTGKVLVTDGINATWTALSSLIPANLLNIDGGMPSTKYTSIGINGGNP